MVRGCYCRVTAEMPQGVAESSRVLLDCYCSSRTHSVLPEHGLRGYLAIGLYQVALNTSRLDNEIQQCSNEVIASASDDVSGSVVAARSTSRRS